MKPIQDALKTIMDKTQLQETYQNLKNQLLNQSTISSFVHTHELSEDEINRNLGTFYEYSTQINQCKKCEGIQKCLNVVEGYTPKLTWQYGQVQLMYETCDKKKVEIQQAQMKKLIKSMYVPEEILRAKRDELYLNETSRLEVVEKIQHIMLKVECNEKFKGLYLSGSFGVGKTFILGVLANMLAEKGVSSLLIYFPEFVREMKSSISDQTLESKLHAVKSASVLMIDDIGAESVSSFTRDEILGTILQYRVLEKMPTFFTSNFNFSELEAHLTTTQRGDEENVKAKRIMERIRVLAEPIEMTGKNLRL